MLYNIDMKRVKQDLDCSTCPKFERSTKTCFGIGTTCFEYNKNLQKCIDPDTRELFDPEERV